MTAALMLQESERHGLQQSLLQDLGAFHACRLKQSWPVEYSAKLQFNCN
jgi:hypothetical protein